jgi:hypothetical protein
MGRPCRLGVNRVIVRQGDVAVNFRKSPKADEVQAQGF